MSIQSSHRKFSRSKNVSSKIWKDTVNPPSPPPNGEEANIMQAQGTAGEEERENPGRDTDWSWKMIRNPYLIRLQHLKQGVKSLRSWERAQRFQWQRRKADAVPIRGRNWRWHEEASSLLVTAQNTQIYLYVHSKAYVHYRTKCISVSNNPSLNYWAIDTVTRIVLVTHFLILVILKIIQEQLEKTVLNSVVNDNCIFWAIVLMQ